MSDSVISAYSIPEPFGKAVAKLRHSLAAADLSIAGELDVSDRIRRQLRLKFEPCRILLVDTPFLLLESVTLDRAGAMLLPLHLVIFASGQRTHVEWLNLGGLPVGPQTPRLKLQTALCRALERIATREDLDRIAS